MQSKSGRRFVGRLEAGADIFSELHELCKRYGIRMGEIRGIGYLADARLATLVPRTGAFVEDEEPTPPAQVVSLLGNVSLDGEALSLHLQAVLLIPSERGPELRAGRLAGGRVVDLEFVIEAFDDFTLVRGHAEGGVAPWVQIVTSANVPEAPVERPRSEFLPGRLGAPHGDDSDPEYELNPGDTLEHPRLGRCTVLHVPDEDRASIRLENGRVVELHLGLLRLQRTSRSLDGRQTFAVYIRKRS